jgi:tetratricopeptide (TPR) repeat protein
MRWIAAVTLCLALAARAGPSFAQEDVDLAVLSRAEVLVRSGEAEQAWALLAPLERQYAGRPDYDYLLGVAALESGRPNRATFVFERVLTVNPGHLAARLEMARAYYALRDFERAEREFNVILASAPPPEIATMSRLYLSRMREGQPARGAVLSGYAEVAVGRDSNVNAAAALSSVFVPGLGNEVAVDASLQPRPDDFVNLGAGLEYTHALTANLGLIAGVDVRQRWYAHADTFDSRGAELQAALAHKLDEASFVQYSARLSEYDLDNASYRDTASLVAQWNRRLNLRTRVALGGEAHRIRYRTDLTRASSSDLYAASAGVTYLLQPATLTAATGSLYFGDDQAVAGRADGDRRLLGVTVGLQRRLMERAEVYVRLSLLDSDYQMPNADFGVTRRDRQYDAVFGLGWEFANGWVLRPQVLYTTHSSNVPLNEYRRTETSLTLRRVWD